MASLPHSSSNMPVPVFSPAEDRRELVLDSTSKAFGRLNAFIYSLQETWDIPGELFTHIHVSLCEAVMNAIIHGNGYRMDKRVYLEARINDGQFVFTVEDEGPGFDFAGRFPVIENCLSSEARGIFMMDNLSESARYCNAGKRLELVFTRR